jgi:hypothetical protein
VKLLKSFQSGGLVLIKREREREKEKERERDRKREVSWLWSGLESRSGMVSNAKDL